MTGCSALVAWRVKSGAASPGWGLPISGVTTTLGPGAVAGVFEGGDGAADAQPIRVSTANDRLMVFMTRSMSRRPIGYIGGLPYLGPRLTT